MEINNASGASEALALPKLQLPTEAWWRDDTHDSKLTAPEADHVNYWWNLQLMKAANQAQVKKAA